ncbi:MAG TPA: hypothetical protein ENN99_16665 [Chloroflexi bacterium]|nr:hypothetical protein [Chloroflexota bacterium]
MTTAEERIQVLKMIQEGQITAEEGSRLLEALGKETSMKQPSRPEGLRQFRVRVTDLETGREKVELRMPWSLINVGINMGARFTRDEIKLEELAGVIQSGAEGKLMDVVDEEDGERVEIFVE